MLQNPERKKKQKYQPKPLLVAAVVSGVWVRGFGGTTARAGIVPVLTNYSLASGSSNHSLYWASQRSPTPCSLSLADRGRLQAEVTYHHGNESHWAKDGHIPGPEKVATIRIKTSVLAFISLSPSEPFMFSMPLLRSSLGPGCAVVLFKAYHFSFPSLLDPPFENHEGWGSQTGGGSERRWASHEQAL